MKKKTIFILAALLFVITLFSGCSLRPATAHHAGRLFLRVNPEISVAYNQEGVVTKIEGLNEDGDAIVSRYSDYIGKDCKTVMQDLVKEIGTAGYFVNEIDDETRNVTIQIEPNSMIPEDDFLAKIIAGTQATVSEMNGKSKVLSIGESDYDIRYATDHSSSEYILRDKAAEIALAHAGISPADAVFDDREFDFENGRAVYELEFMSGGQEYEYDIDARTGKILRSFIGDSGYGDEYDSYYGVSSAGDTDYGTSSDGVTDYNKGSSRTSSSPSSAAPQNPPTSSRSQPSSKGDSNYGNTNYGSTSYNDSGYNSRPTASSSAVPQTPPASSKPQNPPSSSTPPAPPVSSTPSASSRNNGGYGDSDYDDSDYGDSDYDDSDYGES